MQLADFHMHTVFCDGRDTPESMVLSALEKGLEAMGFSGHGYAPYDSDCCMTPEGTQVYLAEVERLRKAYEGRIAIYAGVEQDLLYPALVWEEGRLMPGGPDPETSPYQYRIGSVHYVPVGERLVSIDESEARLVRLAGEGVRSDLISVAEAYFGLLAAHAGKGRFDLVGHFDLITKFNEGGRLFDTDSPRYVRAWQDAADALLAMHVPFEINTGAMARGYRTMPYPALDQLRYLRARGARFFLSSDAHRREHIRYAFDETEAWLAGEGIVPVPWQEVVCAGK